MRNLLQWSNNMFCFSELVNKLPKPENKQVARTFIYKEAMKKINIYPRWWNRCHQPQKNPPSSTQTRVLFFSSLGAENKQEKSRTTFFSSSVPSLSLSDYSMHSVLCQQSVVWHCCWYIHICRFCPSSMSMSVILHIIISCSII